MPTKISLEKMRLMDQLADNGKTTSEIARDVGVSFSVAYKYTVYKRLCFVSSKEYRRYLGLRNRYRELLNDLLYEIDKVGFDITSLECRDNGSLVFRIFEDDLSGDFVELNFRDSLNHCLKLASLEEGKFGISYDNGIVVIRPDDLNTRAFLWAYQSVLEREKI